ncbi:hypothetical protein [Brucella sp. NBRC 12950]|uniref:hypothetical protein n=1 Tax=Brucella sp. NBRC 12950 TaxID=2994518 RepID=UPI0024A07412|nr:hypothetical protein [Brucella sp. NBRC 12950]GLU28005.1 hypothetical protein Brsp01_32380 [Brucella sp. NBRC 12950]
MDEMNVGKVGIFWFVQWQGRIRLLSASCAVADGEPYGDMITYATGHYSTWNRWRRSKATPMERGISIAFEYEEWPRGRISYCRTTGRFLLLCDRKIMREDLLSLIRGAFELPEEQVTVDGDPHYRSVENLA